MSGSAALRGGLALGTMGLMVVISCMNGLSVAGMAIGATVALPELLQRGYDKVMVTGVIQAGSSLGILIPPSVVLVLYAMIARQPVLQLWLAGVVPGLMMAAIFCAYIYIRCRLQPELGPALPAEERAQITWREKISLLREGLLPLLIFRHHDGPVHDRRHQPGREFGGGRAAGHAGGVLSPASSTGTCSRTPRATVSPSRACSCGSSWARFASARSMTGLARSRRSRTC